MTAHVGKSGAVYSGANAIAEVLSWSFDVNANTTPSTAMGDDWETHEVTTKSWSGSLECNWDPADSNGQDTLQAGDEVSLELYPTGNTSSNTKFAGSVKITGVSRSGSTGEIIKLSVSFQGTGAVTESTVV